MTDSSLNILFTPTLDSRVLTTFFDGDTHVHAVRHEGEGKDIELRLAYLVAEHLTGKLEVLGEVFYKHDPYGPADFMSLPVSTEELPVHYQPGNLPTLADVVGKEVEELEESDFTWHQDSLDVADATNQLITAAADLLERYLFVEKGGDGGYDIFLAFSPTKYCSTHFHAATEEEAKRYIAEHFSLRLLTVEEGEVACAFVTPWGFVSPEALTEFELSSAQIPLPALAHLLTLVVRYEDAKEELADAHERANMPPVTADEPGAGVEELLDDEVISERYQRFVDELQAERELAANPDTGEEELIGCLTSSDARVRSAALGNPSLPTTAVMSYARIGRDLRTRLEAIQELESRNA